MPKLKKRSYQQKNAARREMIRQKRISEKGGGDGVLENSGKPIFEGLKSPTDSQGSASSNERSQRMTRTPKIPLLSASKKYKRKKPVTECNTMKKDTESDSTLIKGFYSTTQSVRVCVETLNSDRALDNSVCVKIETDEWYNTAAGFNSACVKLEQVQGDEIHSDHKKQDSFNLVHEQTGCLQMDQCKFMHVQTAPFSHSGSVSLLQNMMTENSAEQHFPIASNSSLHANALVCTSNVETMPTYQLSPSDASTEADDRLFLQSWYGLPSENHNDHSIDGSVSDVKPVLSTLDNNTLHGNGQHGCICNPGSGIVPSVVSPSWPTVDSQPTDPTQVVNIPLPSSSTQSTQPQYFQHQQPQLVTTVKIPHCGGMAEPVFDEKQDTGDQTLEENKLLVLNELQLSLFGSKEDLLAFENGNLLPSVQHFFSDLTPAINFASKTDANLLCTLPVQDLPTSVSIPSVVGSSVTAGSRKSTDAVGERASKSVKKDVPINQSIGLSSDVTESMDQKVAILPLNALHVPMPLLSSDSNSNQSQGISSSYSNEMSLSVSSKMAEFAVTSEINSNLAAESAESSDDDCVEIFIGRNKRKSNSHQSTHPSPKRVRDQGSSRGVVQPTGASTRVNAAIESDQVKKIVKKKSQEYQMAEVRRFGGKTYDKSPNVDSAASKVFDEVFAKPKQAKLENVSYVKQRADGKNSEKEQLQEEDKDPFSLEMDTDRSPQKRQPKPSGTVVLQPAIRMTLTKSPGKPSSVKSELNDNAVDEFTDKKVNVQAYCKSSGRKIRTESPDVSFVKVEKILKQEKDTTLVVPKNTESVDLDDEDEGLYIESDDGSSNASETPAECIITEVEKIKFNRPRKYMYTSQNVTNKDGNEVMVRFRSKYLNPEVYSKFTENIQPKDPVGSLLNGKVVHKNVLKHDSGTTLIVVCSPKVADSEKKQSNTQSKYFMNNVKDLTKSKNIPVEKLTKNKRCSKTPDKDPFDMDKDTKETTNSHDNSSVKEELESPIPSSSDIEKSSQEPYTIRNGRDKKHVHYEEPKEEPIDVDEIFTKVRTTPSRKYHKIFCSRNKGYMDANAEHETPSPPIKAPDEAKDVLPKTLKKGYAPTVNQPNSIESPKSNGELPSEAFKNKLELPETDTAMEVETPQSSSHETDEGEQLLIRHGDEIAREFGLIRDKNLSSKNNGHLKKCDLCGYACKTSDNLKIHMGFHTYGSSFKCELCGYACNKKISMKTHMRIHTGERPYKCEMCDHACKTSGNLKTHMRIHTGERPYMCEVCDHACKTSGHLKRHMRIHTEERPYRCEVCDYACNQSGNLKIHMRIHTEERPYKCEVCDHACKTSGQLKIHMRIHTGERPHKCEVCDYHCNQSGYLKIHRRIHTVEIP